MVKIIEDHERCETTKGIRYTNEFKQAAMNPVVVAGYPVPEFSKRLGIANKSLYDWIKKFNKPRKQREEDTDLVPRMPA